MKQNKRFLIIVMIVILMFLLSGCLAWLGELNPDGDGFFSPGLSGTIIDIQTFEINSSSPGFQLPDLSGGRKAIVAVSPKESPEIAISYYLNITLDNFQKMTYEGQEVIDQESSLENNSFMVMDNINISNKVVHSSADYYAYNEETTMVSGDEKRELVHPLNGMDTFWVRNFSFGDESFKQVSAFLASSSSKMNIYVDDTVDNITSTQLEKILSEYTTRIYDYLVSRYKFGIPYDKNYDGKITLLITPLIYKGSSTDLVGYFDEINFSDNQYSNRCDMIYLNANVLAQNQMNLIYSNIAHEFQHLLFYSEKLKANQTRFYYDDLWINEGLSILASALTGYLDLEEDWRIYDKNYGYFAAPTKDGLTSWEQDREYSNYGSSGLFAYYLFDHYKSLGIIPAITSSDIRIEDVIGYTVGEDFDTIFRNWMTANMIDRFAAIPNELYRYNGLSLKKVPTYKELSLFDSLNIRERGVQYYLIDQVGSNLWFNITTENGDPITPMNIALVIFQ